jgi:glucosamine-6-phosphate deaminase
MIINISSDATELGSRAGHFAALKLKKIIRESGCARLLLSTGSSQFETLESLLKENIEWERVEVFHLDEYIGIDESHNASFRKYLKERFLRTIQVKKFHGVQTEGDIVENIRLLTTELRKYPVDLALIGIGENGHIAFNDPPADFDSHEAYKIVNLDEKCRMQQVNEGWFRSLEDVPLKAVSMTPWQIMQSRIIISCVPHKVKAMAVRNTLSGSLTSMVPATLLKQHPDFNLYLDYNSASEIIPIQRS